MSDSAPLRPELSASGLNAAQVDQLVKLYRDAAERLKEAVLNPHGGTANSQQYKAMRAAQLCLQIDQMLVQLQGHTEAWVNRSLPLAFADGIKRAEQQAKELFGALSKTQSPKTAEDMEWEKLRPAWEKSTSKKSTKKLKEWLQHSFGKLNGDPNYLTPLAREIIAQELRARGVKISGDPSLAIRKEGGSPFDLQNAFAQIDPGTVKQFVKSMTRDLDDAAANAGERAKGLLRKTAQLNLGEPEIDTILAGGVIEGKPVETIRKLRDAFRAVGDGTVVVRDKNGQLMNFEAGYYASMVARTKTREATVRARHEQLQSLDLDLVSIVGLISTHFCTAFLGQVFSLSGKSDKYPAYSELPGGGPPFHPNCSKSTRPFIAELASETQLDQAEGLEDAGQLLGDDVTTAQRKFRDLQIHAQQKDRYATTAKKLFGRAA